MIKGFNIDRLLFFIIAFALPVIFSACDTPVQSRERSSVYSADSVPPPPPRMFSEHLSDSVWVSHALDLWTRFFLDSARSRIVLINETEHPPEFPSPPRYNGDFYYLEYEVDHGAFYMRYCQNGIHWTQAIWREDQLVFLEESCFNYAWSRCGIGFNRRSIFRNGRLIDEWWRTAGDRTKEEFDGDVCNCLTPMDFDQLAELHKKCRFHHDSK